MTAVLTTPPVRPWTHRLNRLVFNHTPSNLIACAKKDGETAKGSPNSTQQNRKKPNKTKLQNSVRLSRQQLVDRWVGFKSLLRITTRIQWEQLGNVQVLEKQDENWQVFAQQVLLDACFIHRHDMKMDVEPPAPLADDRQMTPPSIYWNHEPENGLSTATFTSLLLRSTSRPDVSQQLVLILLRIHQFSTAFRTFSGL